MYIANEILCHLLILLLQLKPIEDIPESIPYSEPDNSTRNSAETALNREITPVDWDQVPGDQETSRTKSTVTASKVAFDF